MRPLLLPKGQRRAAAGAANRGETLTHALLAQLVEQLTLNQRAQGSSPWWCTSDLKKSLKKTQREVNILYPAR